MRIFVIKNVRFLNNNLNGIGDGYEKKKFVNARDFR